MKSIILLGISACIISNASAQITNPVNYTVPAPSYFFRVDPSPDPALRHNRLLQERLDEGVYRLIGTYKVKGHPYLFGGRNKGDMFSPEAKALNIHLNYDTYNQQVGFYSTSNPN